MATAKRTEIQFGDNNNSLDITAGIVMPTKDLLNVPSTCAILCIVTEKSMSQKNMNGLVSKFCLRNF